MAGGAKNIPGLSKVPKIRVCVQHTVDECDSKIVRCAHAVGERFRRSEGGSERTSGAPRGENVGMSNHTYNEKLYPRKSKVSVAMAIIHGLGDPKAMARAAAEQGSRLIFRPA